MYKTQEEVIALIGRPSSTTQLSSKDTWFYYDLTYDQITKTNDSMIQVIFEHSFVTRIRY